MNQGWGLLTVDVAEPRRDLWAINLCELIKLPKMYLGLTQAVYIVCTLQCHQYDKQVFAL